MIFREDALAGKVALVTGGGTGMGAEIAVGFAAVGADVAVVSRNLDHLGPVADRIRALGREAETIVCDVRDSDQVTATVDAVVRRFGGLDVLVNNAAGNFRCRSLDLSPNAWRVVVDIDLNGTFFCSQAAGRHMIDRGQGGVILNMIGDFVHAHGERMAHAAAAKSAIWNLTRSLAKEWGSAGVRVNNIAPGPIATENGIKALGGDDAWAEITRTVPLGVVGDTSDVTSAAVFLASDAASFITGETLNVDGGHGWAGYDLPG